MATTRFRFSAESAAALGVTADASPDDLVQRLGFPSGVKVTSVKADGDGVALNLSGAGLDGGDITGSFTVTAGAPTAFHGFTAAEAATPAPAPNEGG